MDAGLFIYLSRDPGQNIVFKVFDGQDIYVKKLPAPPPPPDSTVHPLTKSKKYNEMHIKMGGGGGGGGSGSLSRVRIFISNLVRATIFIFIQLQHRPFILRYSLFESDGCRIFYLFS